MKIVNNRKCISIVACITALFMCFGLVVSYQASESGDTDFITAENVIYIRTPQELVELSKNCGYDEWSEGKKIVLANNISLKDVDFEPIPYFAGTFDGQGYTISDVEVSGNYQPAGLFGETKAGSLICNLNVTGTMIPSGDKSDVGSIVGINAGTIENCTFSGVVSGEVSVGGIAGYNKLTGQILQCRMKGHTFGEHATGGIVGTNLGKVIDCINDGNVNNVSAENTISLNDIGLNLLVDLYTINSSDITNSYTDSGGIAGYTSGTISNCINNGTIGYSHVGYNAGGIAGRNNGYIELSKNYGEVYGRKDIGGIVGQVEPFIDAEISVSDLAVLEEQLDELKTLTDDTIDHVSNISDSLTASMHVIYDNIDKATAAIDMIQQIEEIETKEDLEDAGRTVQESLGELTDAINAINDELRKVNDTLNDGSNQLNADLKAINAQTNEVYDTLIKIADGVVNLKPEDVIEDTSEADIMDATFGKIAVCVNYATVSGDLNVGGIAGNMSIEYELDPEDDVNTDISWEERKKYEVKAILYACVNHGDITAKKDAVGAICGQMDIGIINSCSGYGSAGSTNGDYVGGIVGIARTTVSDCIVNCQLYGENYIGGIIGSGFDTGEGGSLVKNCYSLVKISSYKQFAGAIAGCNVGGFENNYFVSNELEGINRISYIGKAQPITYAELIAMEELPEELKSFTLTFVADDKVIKTQEFNYGESFGTEVYPNLPKKNGYDAEWDITKLENLCFDTVVTAVYTPYVTAIQSEELRKNDRPMMILEGDFGGEDVIVLSKLDLTDSLKEELKKYGEVVESWRFTFSDDGQKRHVVRFLPERGSKNVKLYIKEDGTWKRVQTTEIGSYLAFDTTGIVVELAVVSKGAEILFMAGLMAGFILILLLCIFLQKKFKIFTKLGKFILKHIVVFLIVSIVSGIVISAIIIMVPKMQRGMEMASIMQEALKKENQSMKMEIEIDISDMHLELSPDLYAVKVDGTRFLVIEENNCPVYICDENIFFENGKGFRVGVDLEGEKSLLRQIQKIYDSTEITKTESEGCIIYSVTAQKENAKSLLSALIPSIEDYLSSAEMVELHITTYEGQIEQVEILGSANLKDSMDTGIKLEAKLMDFRKLDNAQEIIPKEILNAAEKAKNGSLPEFGKDLYRLFLAWANFKGNEEITGTVRLEASCGPINFKKQSSWSSLGLESGEIDNPEEIERMPELIYDICMEGEFSCEKKADSYIYSLKLDEDTIQKLAGIIAPEIVTQTVNLTTGNLYVTVEDDNITSVEVDINGTVTLLFVDVAASLNAVFIFE